MNRLFLHIYLPLAATILAVLCIAFILAFKFIPERAGDYYRNTLTEFREEILRHEPQSPGGILAIADSMDIDARIIPFPGARSGMPFEPPRPGHIFIPGLPAELGFQVEVPVIPRGRHGLGWLIPWLFVGLLVVAEGAVLMTSLRPLKKRLSRLEGAAAAIASGDLAARVQTAPQGDLVDSLGRTFNEMAGRIQALISSHQELLGMVAHEIRTPLARMRFALELLKDATSTTDDGRLARMEEDLSRMDMLLTELLAFNRLSRSDGITVTPIDLEVVASEVAAAESWSRPGIELGIEGSAMCRADAGLVARALSNLVRNAVKHASGRVRISLSLEGGHACASVMDDGPGFDPVIAAKLGRPFVRDPASTGSGLGLAIVERVAALHGGWVEYARAPEGGACVRLCLPLRGDGPDRS